MNEFQTAYESADKIIRVRRSPRSVIFRLILALAIGILGVALWNSPAFYTSPVPFFGIDVRLPVFLLLFLFLVLRPVLLLHDCHHELTAHHIRSISGICSFNRKEFSVPYEDVRGVRADQSILDRILGIGSVVAWTNSGLAPEIRFDGIRRPRKVAEMVSDRIDHALLTHKQSTVEIG